MYLAHWGLHAAPFRNCLDARRFYLAATHEEALARLYFLAEQHRRLGLLFGPAGSGKSLLLEVFARQLRRGGRIAARIPVLGVGPQEFLVATAGALGVDADPSGSIAALWRSIIDRLSELRIQKLSAALMLDDVHTAGAEIIQHITRLAQSDCSPESPLTLILVCDPQRADRLGQRLLELAELQVELEPWNADETATFLQQALRQAGRETPVFDTSAAARVHERANGLPRRVIQLADLSLIAAAGQERDRIDSRIVDEVFEELAVIDPTPTGTSAAFRGSRDR